MYAKYMQEMDDDNKLTTCVTQLLMVHVQPYLLCMPVIGKCLLQK